MPSFSEKSTIEDYLVAELKKRGWRFVAPEELEREGYEESILTASLTRTIKKLNADKGIGEEEVRQILNELKLKGLGQEGSKHILNYFKFGIPVRFEKERVVKYVKLFDHENPKNPDNDFVVSRQVTFQSGENKIRVDIILYVNGIPLVVIECKSPVSFSTNWYDAFKQIKGYEKAIPDLFKYVQIGVAAEQISKYFPIVPWLDDVKIEEWREEGKDSIDSVIEMLSPDTLLDIVKNFLFFRIDRGNATKVIARYMQYRAVNRIVERVSKTYEGEDDKTKGLIWHWQGSGKTLVMIFAANKLYNNERLDLPSIFFVVDRQDLEQQLFEEFNALDITSPEVIVSMAELKRVLKHDDYRGKRGMMITLVHKFRPEEFNELKIELEELSKNKETVMTRKNVIAFVDEGHRTQYGLTATQMRAIFKNGFFFGLTGTPIVKKGRDTYLQFSNLPAEKYLDKYFILDSIKDGFTVKIAYQPRLEKEVHLKRDLLDAFLEVEYEEIPEDLREKVKERVRKKLNMIKLYLENPDRIKRICQDIAEHFKENVDGRFKAMVVAASREACVTYKNELDKLLPKEYSEVVMTYTRDDSKQIKSYLDSLLERFNGKEIQDIKNDIISKFKEEDSPKILIVTDMLLTGFDAPVLQTMYLDKPLKEHRLLQAIARTNRPYKDVKEAGLIIDYIGILKEFKKAFEMYSKEDIDGALYNIEQLEKEFAELVKETMSMFSNIPKDRYDREALIQATIIITQSEENEKKFVKSVGTLRRLFEVLGVSDIKLELLSDYKWIMNVYTYYTLQVLRSKKDPSGKFVEEFFKKTVKYVHKTTEIEEFKKDLPILEFDENFLENLEKKAKSKKEKAANIVFTLNKYVLVEKSRNPVLENIAEKVSRLMRMWRDKNKDFEKMYREGSAIIEEINELQKRQKDLKLSNLEYSVLLGLEQKFGQNKELVDDVKELSKEFEKKKFTGWLTQKTVMKELEKEIRKFLRRYIKPFKITLKDIDAISKNLLESVKNHGE